MDVTALIDALRTPAAFPDPADRVDIIQTHISVVFLVGNSVYKIKKPVRFGFLDFSTPDQRRHFCEEEVRLNRRLAPDTYLGIVPICIDDFGSIRINGPGTPVEYAVHMRRLPEDRMLDNLIAAGEVNPSSMDDIARRVSDFHREAPTGPGVDEHATPDRVLAAMTRNLDESRALASSDRFPWSILTTALIEQVRRFETSRAQALSAMLTERIARGRVREGHGDLHCANICLTLQGPVIYDCLEFDRAIRCGDVAREIAFLGMDLDARGRPDLSERFLKAYARAAVDPEALILSPLFAIHFAMVRGKVALLRAVTDDAAGQQQANRYYLFAARQVVPPMLILMCGLPGSGKSFAARRLAEALRIEPLIQSDVVRKELLNIETTRHWEGSLDSGPYTPAHTERTYAALLDRAAPALTGISSVIIDAAFTRRSQRQAFLDAARSTGTRVLVVHIAAAESTIHRRLLERKNDPDEVSDAGLEVYRRARAAFEPPTDVPPKSLVEFESGRPMEGLIRSLIERACDG